MDYDDLGRLTRDENADGAVKTLTRTDTDDAYEVTLSTRMGRSRTNRVHKTDGGASVRTATGYDGLSTTTRATADGATTTTRAGRRDRVDAVAARPALRDAGTAAGQHRRRRVRRARRARSPRRER